MPLEGPAVHNRPETIIVRIASEAVSITPEHVARYAGGSGYKMDTPMSETACGVVNRAMELAAPAVAYAVHPVRALSPEGRMLLENRLSVTVPRRERDVLTRFLVAAVCTLGPALEAACRELARQGDFLRSLLLDAAGVALLEMVSRRAFDILTERASKERLFCGCRFAPGYGTMHMSSQDLLFALVDADAIGVRLNESMIMSPNKSLSFFIRWTKKETPQPNAHKCEACSLHSCPFRV